LGRIHHQGYNGDKATAIRLGSIPAQYRLLSQHPPKNQLVLNGSLVKADGFYF
jgi:hypothetical protein